MKITGTFLDEISHDIPSASWGSDEWARDFDAMKKVGIDTVILIRCGHKDKMTFDSEVLKKNREMRPVYLDLVDLFLKLAEKRNMNFYFGLYDSGVHWHKGEYQKEIDINIKLISEVIDKYSHRKAFKGWYLSHELSLFDKGAVDIYLSLTETLKKLKPLPMIMSPYVHGRKQFDDAISSQEHRKTWDKILSALKGQVDILAFQDGQVEFNELKEILMINKELADKYGFRSWSNVETFERGMPINFLPIGWPNLRFKMEMAEEVGVEKLITFEFSHFLSPNSMYASAHNLFKRYEQWIKNRNS